MAKMQLPHDRAKLRRTNYLIFPAFWFSFLGMQVAPVGFFYRSVICFKFNFWRTLVVF